MRVLSIAILCLWACAIILAVRLKRVIKSRGFRHAAALWVAAALCLGGLASYYFPRKNWVPSTVRTDYIQEIPLSVPQSAYDDVSINALLNKRYVIRSAVCTLLGRDAVVPTVRQGRLYSLLMADYAPNASPRSYRVACFQKNWTYVSVGDQADDQLYFLLGGQGLFAALDALLH